MEKDQPFVKQEYGASLAQSAKSAEEINLIRKIETRTRNLLQSLNSIESITSSLNKILLPKLLRSESEANVDKSPPQGWLECHLADLDHAIYRAGQIYEEVTRLMQATKIDKVGK